MRFLSFLLIPVSLLAQDKPKETPGKAPKISTEQRAVFWRAQAEFSNAQAQAAVAKAKLDAAIEDIRKTCDAIPQFGPDGEPQCPSSAVKPATPPPVK
jgi:hypothetical protein